MWSEISCPFSNILQGCFTDNYNVAISGSEVTMNEEIDRKYINQRITYIPLEFIVHQHQNNAHDNYSHILWVTMYTHIKMPAIILFCTRVG